MQHFIHVSVKFLLYLRRRERRTWPGTTVGQVVREDCSWNQYLSQCLESGNEERSLPSEGTEQLWWEGAEQDQGLKGQHRVWGGNRGGTAKMQPWGETAGLWAREIDWPSSHQQSEAIYTMMRQDQMCIWKGHLSFCLEINHRMARVMWRQQETQAVMPRELDGHKGKRPWMKPGSASEVAAFQTGPPAQGTCLVWVSSSTKLGKIFPYLFPRCFWRSN